MEPDMIAGMAFSLIFFTMIGTFILAFPLTRRLGQLMEEWIRLRRGEVSEPGTLEALQRELGAMRRLTDSLDGRLDAIAERQEFLESVLEKRQESPALPRAGASSRSLS